MGKWAEISDNKLVLVTRGHFAEAPKSLHGDSQNAQLQSDALEELLNRHYPWITRVCLMEIKDREAAIDCVQECMVQISRSLNSFNSQSKFHTWAYVIVRRTLKRYRQSQWLHRLRFPLGTDQDVASGEEFAASNRSNAPLLQSERANMLIDYVRKLPEKQRMAIMLHYFEDLPLTEVASRMAISEGAIKSHLSRARKRLEELIDLADDETKDLLGFI